MCDTDFDLFIHLIYHVHRTGDDVGYFQLTQVEAAAVERLHLSDRHMSVRVIPRLRTDTSSTVASHSTSVARIEEIVEEDDLEIEGVIERPDEDDIFS